MKPRKWTESQLREAARKSTSTRQVLHSLGLKEAGGNYAQLKKYLEFYKINTRHFQGRGWSRGLHFPFQPRIPLDQILVKDSNFQSYKLKNRLIRDGLKTPLCEECGWAKRSEGGRLPLELDHINGDARDNRLENLRILCPNCHSLKPTHRSCNQKARVAEWYTHNT
jgi:hypothetical protein